MDFALTEEQEELAGLAGAASSSDRMALQHLKERDRSDDWFDRDTWAEFAKANLLGVALPESRRRARLRLPRALPGARRSRAAPSRRCPLIHTLVSGRAPDRASSAPTRSRRGARARSSAATCCSPRRSSSSARRAGRAADDRRRATATAGGIDGEKVERAAARIVGRAILVPGAGRRRTSGCSSCRPNADGHHARAPGDDEPRAAVRGARSTACTSATTRCSATIADRARDPARGSLDRTTIAHLRGRRRASPRRRCASPREYTTERKQFDRAIGTFQAVGQRMADCFIDNRGDRAHDAAGRDAPRRGPATTRSRSRPRSSGRPTAAAASATPRCTSTAASASTSTTRSTATSCGSSSTSSRSARRPRSSSGSAKVARRTEPGVDAACARTPVRVARGRCRGGGGPGRGRTAGRSSR